MRLAERIISLIEGGTIEKTIETRAKFSYETHNTPGASHPSHRVFSKTIELL